MSFNFKQPLYALASWSLLCLASFYGAIVMGWGPAESSHDPSSLWMYSRRALMISLALLVPKLAVGRGVAASYGWSISLNWLLVSIPVGIAMGFGNPGGFDPRFASAITLACMHAFATELFFRAYLITALSSYFKSFWPPVLVSSLMYGLFYLTVSTTWQQPGARKYIFVVLFTLIGILHGWFYKKSKSFLVPWIIHFLGVLKYNCLF